MKFSIKDFFNKCHQIGSFLRIWSHLLKKPLIDNFIFCVAFVTTTISFIQGWTVISLFPNPIFLFNRAFFYFFYFYGHLYFSSRHQKLWNAGRLEYLVLYQLRFYRMKLGNIRKLSELLWITSQSPVFLPKRDFCHYLEKTPKKYPKNKNIKRCKLEFASNILLMIVELSESHDKQGLPCKLHDRNLLSAKLQYRKLLSCKLHGRILVYCKLHDTKFLRRSYRRHIYLTSYMIL